MENLILTSIIIPVLNEEGYIKKCIESIIFKNDTSNIEIIVVDGGSNDRTLTILEDLKIKYDFIKVFHNEKKITPSALNIGIKNSNGRFIIRLDAHAEYSSQYIEKSISSLKNSPDDVVNVGGVIKTESSSKSFLGKAIAICLSSPFGVGNSTFRTMIPSKKIYVETVPFGCFRREIFSEIGYFNESEHRNEDLEFNKRILNANKKIILDPEISSIYFPKSSIKEFIFHQIDNGKIVTKSFRGNKSFHLVRHFIPLFFVLYLVSLVPILLLLKMPIVEFIYIFPLILYLILNIFFSFNLAIINKVIILPYIFFTFITLHISYGLGSLYGLFKK